MPAASLRLAVTYHHSMRYSGCAPKSAGKLISRPGSTAANPAASSPSPAKPPAAARSPHHATTSISTIATTARLTLIGEHPEQILRCRARKPHDRNDRRNEGRQQRHRKNQQPLRGKHVEWQ